MLSCEGLSKMTKYLLKFELNMNKLLEEQSCTKLYKVAQSCIKLHKIE